MTQEPYSASSIESFLDKLASADPEPGGGGGAALAGALAAALVSMVANLTLGKEKYAGVQDQVAALKTRSEDLRSRLQDLVTLDAQAYGAVAAAMKLPRGTDDEKASRATTLQVALRHAAAVPLDVVETAVQVARLSETAAEIGNTNAVSDAGVAAILAEAAAQSAALNVKINLPWIDGQAFRDDAWGRVEAALAETGRLRGSVLSLTYSKI